MSFERTKIWTAALALVGLSWAGGAVAQDIEDAKDETWVTVSGTVVSSAAQTFRLDYGDGIITVEMDDFDTHPDGYGILVNDSVVVSGRIDHDLFERKKIEAASVYVESLGTQFYANSADEEDFMAWSYSAPIVPGVAAVTGRVTEVDGREFTIASGAGRVRVDTAQMPYNPMDDKGFMQVKVGDLVKVSGELEATLFDAHEIEADVIIKLDR